MSIQVNTYVIYGAKFSYKDFEKAYPEIENDWKNFDKYRDDSCDEINHHNGLCLFEDTINGKYVIIGKVLAKTKVNQYFEEVIDSDYFPTPNERFDILTSINKNFKKIHTENLGLIVFSRYT